MAVIEYIGMRYAPFFGWVDPDTGVRHFDWNRNIPYKYLTIVQHQGASYISIRDVPSFVPITETSYWVRTFEFSSQVAALNLALDEVRKTLSQAEGDVGNLNKALENLASETEGKFSEVDGKIKAITAKSLGAVTATGNATDGHVNASLGYPVQLEVLNESYVYRKAVMGMSPLGEVGLYLYKDPDSSTADRTVLYKDPIVAYGTKDGWYYEKHLNGVVKAWKTQITEFQAESEWDAKIPYPFEMASVYYPGVTAGDYRIEKIWADPMADNGKTLWVGAYAQEKFTGKVYVSICGQVKE